MPVRTLTFHNRRHYIFHATLPARLTALSMKTKKLNTVYFLHYLRKSYITCNCSESKRASIKHNCHNLQSSTQNCKSPSLHSASQSRYKKKTIDHATTRMRSVGSPSSRVLSIFAIRVHRPYLHKFPSQYSS